MDRGAWWAPWGREELDMTERLTHTRARVHTHMHTHVHVLGAFLAFTGVADTFSKHDFFPPGEGFSS